MANSTYRGEGILRIAPVGMPWSIWLFWELVAAVAQGRFTAGIDTLPDVRDNAPER